MTRDCVLCKKMLKVKRRTIYECLSCSAALHPECFFDFHTMVPPDSDEE